MKLIADCGSTKTDWCILDGNKLAKQVFTAGMNAVMLSEEEMCRRFGTELVPELGDYADSITDVFFYGAGCLSDDVCRNVAGALRPHLPSAGNIEVYTDLLAAARALCGHEPGIACIMGTGSNSCLYDGHVIADNVSPLGFILGDEGSGAVLGKLLIGDVLKQQLPADLCAAFLKEYDLDRLTIIRRVYKEAQANRFLASVTPFLHRHIDRPEIHALVLGSFRLFFRRNIHHYEGYSTMPVNFIGSIAYYFSDVLAEAAAAEGCRIGTVLRSPMDGLLRYHAAMR